MKILKNVAEVLEDGIELVPENRVVVLIPPQKEWKQDFQALADAALDMLEENQSIVYNQGIKEVVIQTEVIKSTIDGIEKNDIVYFKPVASKHFATIKDGEIHLVYKEDIFFIKKAK